MTIKSKMGLGRGIRVPLTTRSRMGGSYQANFADDKKTTIVRKEKRVFFRRRSLSIRFI